MEKKVVFLVCTGLGRINRGYESFARECYEVLKDNSDFKMYLIKGGGKGKNDEIVLPNLHRKHRVNIWFSRIFKTDPYIVEQFTFCIFLLPQILLKRPSIIYYSDFILGTYLWHLRRFLKFRYKLLFSNGAPNGHPFKTEDHVQQLLPLYITQATNEGTHLSKQTLLPYGININVEQNISRISAAAAIRKKLQLPMNKKIIISVGAINTIHKRMDYVVNEFSQLDQNVYFLILLGQIDDQSKSVTDLANKKLSHRNYLIKQVNSEQINDYLSISDYFILASLNEGLPRVLLEALSNGLLPVVHDYAVTRETLGKYGIFKDLTKQGALLEAITEADLKGLEKDKIITYSWNHYSWDKLKDNYKRMIGQLL